MRSLLRLLPDVRVVVPMGTVARQVWDLYLLETGAADSLFTLPTWHPSSLGLNGGPGRRDEVTSVLRAAARLSRT